MSQSPNPTNVSAGLNFLKGLTLVNVLAILLLLLGLVPAYVTYRLASDPALLDRFLSAYHVSDPDGACRLIQARQRGENYTYAVITGFAFEGQSRWTIGVTLNHPPDTSEISSNCALLQAIISFMHGDRAPPDIIWQTKDVQGREGEKGER